MSTFVVSDLHFNHSTVWKSQRNDFATVKEMNEFIINQWKDQITRNDVVINLGDFVFGDDMSYIDYVLSELPFRKMIFVAGNHDTPIKLARYCSDPRIKVYSSYEQFFDQRKVIFTHIPVSQYILNDTSRDGIKRFANVHGHIHNVSNIGKSYFNANWDIERGIYKIEDILNRL